MELLASDKKLKIRSANNTMSLKSYLSKEFDLRYLDLNGIPVKRTPHTHPYNYDGFVLWRNSKDINASDTVYSDRLYQWDWEKYNKCCYEIFGNTGQYFDNRKPEDIEKFLSLYFGNEVKLCVLMQYCNKATGFPYWRFDYKEK